MINIKDLERKNFSHLEFYSSETADALRLDNEPKEQATLSNLNMLADKMQYIRELLGSSIRISSGYRSPELNNAVGGSDTSKHMLGLACDFFSSFGTAEEITKFLKAKRFDCDVCLIEAGWVHIHFKHNNIGNRMLFGSFLKDENNIYRFKRI